MVRLSTCMSYRSLLLILCYVKHSVGSKLFFQLNPRHQLHIGDDYKLNCSKLISMHYYLGNIVCYIALLRNSFISRLCMWSAQERCWPIYTPRYLVQVVCFILLSLIFTLKLQDWLKLLLRSIYVVFE